MMKRIDIGAYSAYAIAVKHGYKGTEEEWNAEQERNRIASEDAANKSKEIGSTVAQIALAVEFLKDESVQARNESVSASQVSVQAKESVDSSVQFVSQAKEEVERLSSEVLDNKNASEAARDSAIASRDSAAKSKESVDKSEVAVNQYKESAEKASKEAVLSKEKALQAQEGA